ncbi:MAG TPA: hypothetical protein VEK08_16655 [Planctomycetota bacterium]|nr:hypothetical protein [Planctomycetota bacterium]
MAHDYELILRQNDESNAYEFPSQFNYERLNRDVRLVHAQLERVLKRQFEIEDGAQIQDASFHAAIILKSASMGTNTTWQCALRFSNFGRLAACSDEESINSKIRKSSNRSSPIIASY